MTDSIEFLFQTGKGQIVPTLFKKQNYQKNLNRKDQSEICILNRYNLKTQSLLSQKGQI